ncbi:hypothetical protein LTR59_007542 [Friedmanniomyces endolithicus]|nr:hypothetical protein LTR94_006597 [Friedmanniomyces endolithicus]KAK0795147.1 hypothetical protein LTR59_007542 [Friedmanniomyces endolithicus]KAK0802025.1 hypothetical protein LTR38_006600 [Friedmanniomyces endolithicus]KAK0820752.1 hypothetical protein LTR75_001338 [Friedmanniomyces endolithicus]
MSPSQSMLSSPTPLLSSPPHHPREGESLSQEAHTTHLPVAYADINTPSPTELESRDMASAIERRRRQSLPITREESTISLRANYQLARVRVRDLQPVRALTLALAPNPARSRFSSPGGHDSSLGIATRSPTSVARMPQLQARNDVNPDPSNVYVLKEMIWSLENEVNKDEADYMKLKSTMEWDSEDEDEKPGLRRLIGSLKRKSTVSDGNGTTNRRSLMASKLSVASRQRNHDTAQRNRALSPPTHDGEEKLEPPYARTCHSTEQQFASRFVRKMEEKSKLQAATRPNGHCLTSSPTDDARLLVDQAQCSPVPPRACIPGAAADVGSLQDSNPSSNSLALYKPLPRTPEPPEPPDPPKLSSLRVPSQRYGSALQLCEEARDFMQHFPPPTDPDTPTRSAGRSLRYAKSDCSVRASFTGPRLAPPIAPAKRTTKVEIINPDDSPGVYIARAATAAGLPSSPLHPDWEAAIETVKSGVARELKEADCKAREDEKSKKPTAPETRSPIQLWKAQGKIVLSPGSCFDSPHTIDYSAMTDEDLESLDSALQRELQQCTSPSVAKRLFRRIGEDKAKEKVIRQAVLAKQKWLVDRELETRAGSRRSAEGQQATAPVNASGLELVNVSHDTTLVGRASRLPRERADQPALKHTSDPESDSGGRHAISHLADAHNDEIPYGDTEPERDDSRPYGKLPGTSTVERSAYPVGLGITGMAGLTSALDTATAIDMRSVLEHPPSFQVDSHSPHLVDAIYPASPSHPRSPFGEEPLKVARSPTAPTNRFGKPVFQPTRNDYFMHQIEAAARRAKELRSIGSHPALRESPSRSDLPPEPATVPMVTLHDIWDFEEEEAKRVDDILAGRIHVGRREGRKDSGACVDEHIDPEGAIDVPVIKVESDSGNCTSFFDNDAAEKGEVTGSSDQQSVSSDYDEDEQVLTRQDFHDRLSQLNDFVNLQYPGTSNYAAEDDEPEYVDNPDYDPAQHEPSIPYANTDTAPSAPGTLINDLDIDTVIAQWEESSSGSNSSASSPTSTATACCVHAESLLHTTPYWPIPDPAQLRTTVPSPLTTPEKLDLRFFPSYRGTGREQYGATTTLLTCNDCSRVVCPQCVRFCAEALCRQVMCGRCWREAGRRCDIHEVGEVGVLLQDGGVVEGYSLGGGRRGTGGGGSGCGDDAMS